MGNQRINTVDATLPSLVQPAGNMKFVGHLYGQWEFQDPKMEVLYQIRPYSGGISPEI